MVKKLLLGVVVAAAGMWFTTDQASANHGCYRGGYGGYGGYHHPGVSVRSYSHSPYGISAYRSYRPPAAGYFGPGYGFGPGPGYFGPGYGLGSPFMGRGNFGGYGRSGISIGIGF